MANLRGPYEQIKLRIQTMCPSVKFVTLWNNQLRDLKNQKTWDFPLPAVLIEFVRPEKVGILGNGVRIFEPLYIRFHILQDFYNATNGVDFMEENPGGFDLLEELYSALFGYEPDGCVAMFPTQEEFDYDHDNIQHFIGTYQTNYVDFNQNRPVNGVPWDASPRVLDIIMVPWDEGIIIQNDEGPLLQDNGGYFLWESAPVEPGGR